MACCIGSHKIAPNSGTNRHQNRHQSLAHFSQSHPSDVLSDRGDCETRNGARTQRILAPSATRNRHQNSVKPLSNQSETDMQPAPPLSVDIYPTCGAFKRPFAVLPNPIFRLSWMVSSLPSFGADLRQSHWIACDRDCSGFRDKDEIFALASSRKPSELLKLPLPRSSRCLAGSLSTLPLAR